MIGSASTAYAVRPFDWWMMAISIASVFASISVAIVVARVGSKRRTQDRRFEALTFALGRLDNLDYTGIDPPGGGPGLEFSLRTKSIQNGLQNLLRGKDNCLASLLQSEFDLAKRCIDGTPKVAGKLAVSELQVDLSRDLLSYNFNPKYRRDLRDFVKIRGSHFDIMAWLEFREITATRKRWWQGARRLIRGNETRQ